MGERPVIPFCRANSIDTGKEFSKLRFLHTDSNFPPMGHFALKGSEIHGNIRVLDEFPIPEIPCASYEHEEFDLWKISVEYER
jgi:hypothetical protein